MLKHVNVKTVHAIIMLSRALRVRYGMLRGDMPLGMDMSAAGELIKKLGGDPVYQPLRHGLETLIDGQNMEQRAELIALMYSGRGDASFSDLVGSVGKNFSHPGSQMCSKTPLARYLNRGLEKLGLPTLPDPFGSETADEVEDSGDESSED